MEPIQECAKIQTWSSCGKLHRVEHLTTAQFIVVGVFTLALKLKEMRQNTILKQRYTHSNHLAQDKNILSVGNLHFSTEENQNQLSTTCPDGPYTSCLKMQLSMSEANATFQNKEENGGEQQPRAAAEAKGSSHLLIVEDEEDSEVGHDYNAKISKWNSTDDENDDDYDGNNTGDGDTVLSGLIARDSNLLLPHKDADEDDYSDGDGDDEGTSNGCDESSVDEKSESSVSGGDCHEYSDSRDSDEDSEAGSINLDHVTSDVDNEVQDESISFMTRGSTNLGPFLSLEDANHDNNTGSVVMNEIQSLRQDSLCGEFQQYLDPSPQFRARLQYRVRIVLIHPLFVLGGQSESSFLNIYNKIFGKSLLSSGFRSVTELCQAMPHVVNRKVIDEQGELCLVESSNNLRAVASIRSGLRRIVYNILQSHPQGITSHNFEEEFYNETGKTLTDVLKDHAYSIPRAECMVRDMLDIAYLRYTKSSQTIMLCKDAEDPALTDGLLIGRTTSNCISFNENASGVGDSNTWEGRRIAGKNAECSHSKTSTKKIEGNRLPPDISSIRMPPDSFSNGLFPDKSDDEAVNFRIVTYQGRNTEGLESSQTSEDGEESISCGEDYILQVRLCLRLLLGCWNFGNGIEAGNLLGIYERTFATKLNLNELGFTSIEELVNCWSNITLLLDQKPGIVFLRPSAENKRIVKTVCTGLREAVFSVLLSSFPDGMDVYSFLQSLNQSYSGNLGGILKDTGYLTDEISDTDTFFRDEQHNPQLYCSKALRLLFQDMSDFVRLGCQEDGSLLVKLRGKDFPVLDFPDCGLDGFLPEKIWSDKLCSEEAATSMAGQQPRNCSLSEKVNISKAHFYSTNFERDSHTCSSTKLSLQILKHQFRLILGSPLYLNCGIPCQQLASIYKERVGHALILAEHKDIKSFLSLMPEVVSISSVSGQVFLKRTNKNCRILSVVKSGIRQVLYWSLLKNPGGIWDQLIEGWYSDFDGKSLVTTLSKHGYKISRKSYLASIVTFLDDMYDFVCRHPTEGGLYILVEDSVDPTSADARLLGMSPSDIQYDPLREHLHSLYTDVDSFGKCGTDTLDHLANEFAVKLKVKDIGGSDSHVRIFEHVPQHSSSKASLFPRGKQALEISNADKEDDNGYDEEETQPKCTSSNAKISNNIFDSVSEDDTGCHRENIGSESKKSKFSSELDQSASSDEEFRKFCRPRISRRNNFEPLGVKVRAYP